MAEHVALLDFGSNAVRFVHARVSRRSISPIAQALTLAGEQGKEVVVRVELAASALR